MQPILQSYDSKFSKSHFFANFENCNLEIVSKIYQIVTISSKQTRGFVITRGFRYRGEQLRFGFSFWFTLVGSSFQIKTKSKFYMSHYSSDQKYFM